MPDVAAPVLHRLTVDILAAVGTAPDSAETVADSLINANLAGHDSHGAMRLLGYISGVGEGYVVPAAASRLVSTSGATAIVDGQYGWGQPAMWLATEAAIDRARELGLGAAVVRRCYHIGRVAPYVEAIAEEGMIGLAMTMGAPSVAPFGGTTRVMGTNPIAWALPRAAGKPPVCLDVATAGIAEGKVRVARARGLPVPAGNIIDQEGRPSTTPDDFYAGGALLPFGFHKGSGFSLLAQFVGRGLAGMDPSSYDGPRGLNGPFVLAIDIARFSDLDQFRSEVEAQCAVVTASPPAEGVSEVLLPGEPELATRAIREHEGIPIPDSTWKELLALAREHGVIVPS